jgi:mRNA interferase MazF
MTLLFSMAWRMTTLTSPERYEIYFADLNPTIGCEINKIRPVVVISGDEMNTNLETVVICPLTSKLHPKWRTRLQINCAEKQAEIAVDQIRAISKKRLRQKIDQLSVSEASQLRRIITEMYGE